MDEIPKPEQAKCQPIPAKPISIYSTLIDDDKNTILHYAAAKGKNEEFNKSITFDELNMENYLGWTPLMMACRNKHVKTVELLLQLGGDVTRKNKFGMSVLHISVGGGNLEIVKMILEHLLTGGISKRLMQATFSPLSMAILFRNNDILKYLINEKFDLDAKTPRTGITPLMFAASMEDNEATSLLLKNKADPSIKNYLNETAGDIKKARHQKQEPAVKKLTPAELISRSPHMAPPQCMFATQPSYLNITPTPFVCLRKASPSPTVFVATPNISPIGPMTPQIFFPPNFNPSSYMSYSHLPVTNVYANTSELLNINLNKEQTELILTPNVQ